ncbi:MAG: hypothetical protein ACYYKD_04870 [Rhodospirillales bacterium]
MPSRTRYAHRTGCDPQTRPFDTTEEAWFWYMQCVALRREGARLKAGSGVFARPCEPDDLAACAVKLVRRRRLTVGHVDVLTAYGAAGAPPDCHAPGQFGHARLWDEALDRMTTLLRAKGIVRPADEKTLPPPVSPAAVHMRPGDMRETPRVRNS